MKQLQDSAKKYFLTDLGTEVYKILTTTEERITTFKPVSYPRKRSVLNRACKYLSFEFFIPYIIENPNRTFFEFLIFLILLSYLSSISGIIPILFWIEILYVSFPVAIVVVLLSWFVSSTISYMFLKFVFKAETNLKLIFLSLPVAYHPILIYIILYHYLFVGTVQEIAVVLITVGFIVAELWSILVLSRYISKLNGILLTKSLLIGVSLGYISMTFHILINFL